MSVANKNRLQGKFDGYSDSDLPVREAYYLNNWYRYKENLKQLNDSQLEMAKTLFRALKELDPADRIFLATKYDRPTIQSGKGRVHPSDRLVADELGMEATNYTKQRRVIQKKMNAIMQEQKNRQRGEMTNDK